MIRIRRIDPAPSARPRTPFAAFAAALLVLAAILAAPAAVTAAPVPEVEPGDTVYIGEEVSYDGSTIIFPVWATTPADLANPGDPDFWAYCIEQSVSARDERTAVVAAVADFLGGNYFATDPTIPGKVGWVLAHSYPTLTVAELAVAAGIPGLTLDEAINGTTTAIWRFTDVDFDAPYFWRGPRAQALHEYLIAGAKAGPGVTTADFAVEVAVTAPAGAQAAGTLIGPFTVSTDQPSVSVTASPALTITDAAGTPVDPAAVVDGQELYLDARGETTAGSGTITASARGSSASGHILRVPNTVGTPPTAGDHGQSLILIAPGDATTDAAGTASWAALAVPEIGTLATTDNPVDDKVLPLTGGTITDTVAYRGLPLTVCDVGGCEREYVLEGELMHVDGATVTPTGITAQSDPFVVTDPSGAGTVEVEFTLTPAQALAYAGETLVVYEYLYEWRYDLAVPVRTLIAEHTDPADADQSVAVAALVAPTPTIGTTLVDAADGDRLLPWNGGVVVDTVAYENLTPGVSYTLEGELYRVSTGLGTGVVGTTTFVPTTADGTVDVVFTVPVGYAGDSLVAFEWLFETGAGAPIAQHTDITDPAQTVAVGTPAVVIAAVVGTGGGSLAITGGVPLFGAGLIGLAALGLGAGMLVVRRRTAAGG